MSNFFLAIRRYVASLRRDPMELPPIDSEGWPDPLIYGDWYTSPWGNEFELNRKAGCWCPRDTSTPAGLTDPPR
jgi:hypothetical protein